MNLLAVIYDIKGKESVRLNDNPKLFDKLKKKAIRDSIKGSNAIENICTSEKRLDKIIYEGSEGLTHGEKGIVGHKNVLEGIHEFNETIVFGKTAILSLHKRLLDVAMSENRGQFKKEMNLIGEQRNGKHYAVFVPTPPKEVEEALDQMLLAFNAATHNENINPLLLIPCFILDFLCVHPFDDGNGRMSRLSTLLLFIKAASISENSFP